MPLLTTTIGAYPKPAYVPTPDWFRAKNMSLLDPSKAYDEYLLAQAENVEALLDQGTRQAVLDQVNVGIDIPTDGEIRRENYIYYHCRHMNGFDFTHMTRKVMRSGSWVAEVPTVTAPLSARNHFLPRDYHVAQAVTERPVKITVPGPLTITDSTANIYYPDEKQLGAALADTLNAEIRALVEAGCTWIQIDEPVFAREPEKALAFGFENLERCWYGVPAHVTRAVHMCCGYPDMLDNEHYHKAEQDAYLRLATQIEDSSIQAISFEDAHRYNDLTLLEQFQNTTVIFGAVAIARSRIEPVDEIVARLEAALQHIDPERLIVAPDCGLGMLGRERALDKLANMVAAAQAVA